MQGIGNSLDFFSDFMDLRANLFPFGLARMPLWLRSSHVILPLEESLADSFAIGQQIR